jgi:DNA-binding transcriptional LysR family regulator
MDQLDALRVFAQVAERGSLSAVARARNTSLATVSRTVSHLEEELGARLVERNSRRLVLTKVGQAYLDHVLPAIAALDEARAALSEEVSELSGRVVMTCPRIFASQYLGRWLCSFAADHPRLEVVLSVADSRADLAQLGADLGIRTGPLDDSTLVARKLGTYRRKLVASARYLAQRGAPDTPADLARHDCIVLTAQQPARDWQFAGHAAVSVRGRWTCDDNDVAMQAAMADQGIARLPSWQVDRAISAGTLVEVLAAHPSPPNAIQVVYLSRRQMPRKVRTLVDFIATSYAAELGST